MNKLKQGDICPKTGYIFWSHHKSCPNNEYWVTADTFNKLRGYDPHWTVYYLPNENYYGSTKRYKRRIIEHKKNGKNVDGALVIKTFATKKEAFEFEAKKQIKEKSNGYIFTNSWRKNCSLRCLSHKPSDSLRKKVICVQTGVVYESVRHCERCFGKSRGNLSKHLKGNKQHKTFHGLNFKYHE